MKDYERSRILNSLILSICTTSCKLANYSQLQSMTVMKQRTPLINFLFN